MSWSARFTNLIAENRAQDGKTPVTNKKTAIQNLQPGLAVNLIGVILTKECSRSVVSKKNPGKERYCMPFTIRDSAEWFINATCWGDKEFVCGLSTIFNIGDVVEISSALVISNLNANDERFKPWSPCPFQLTISENSAIEIYEGLDKEAYISYRHLPIKSQNDYYTLQDVNINGQSLHGEHVNLLAVVKQVGQIKDITTKAGKQKKRCEVKLFDETCSSFPFVLWDEELISFTQNWIPHQCVLFINDARISLDEFRMQMVSTAVSKTIVILNPETREAENLYQYAQLNPQAYYNMEELNDDNADVELNLITEVYSIEQIKQLMENICLSDASVPSGIVYGYFSWFDIDNDQRGVTQLRCSDCQIKMNSQICANPNCVGMALSCFEDDSGITRKAPYIEFNIMVSLSDHTGTLKSYLTNSIAEQLLQIKANQFLQLSDEKKTQLKWNFLFERFKIYFKLRRTNDKIPRMTVKILDCFPANPEEVAYYIQWLSKQ